MAASFVVAITVAVATVLIALFAELGHNMIAAPSQESNMTVSILVSGFVLAALIAGSHFLPHIKW